MPDLDAPALPPARPTVTEAQKRAVDALQRRRAEQLARLSDSLSLRGLAMSSRELAALAPRRFLSDPVMMADLRAVPGGKPAGGGYRVVNKGKDRGEIWLYGTIGQDFWGEGVSAKQFADDLKSLGAVKDIDVRINSDGGAVTEARAMYSLLVEHPAAIHVHIDGIAASAASFLAMAGKDIAIAEGGFVMIHNARMIAYGEADDMRRAATLLDTVNQTIRDTYAARTKAKVDDIRKWMDAETWMTGTEAVERGFADRIVENMRAVACTVRPELRFRHVPSALLPKRAAAAARLADLGR